MDMSILNVKIQIQDTRTGAYLRDTFSRISLDVTVYHLRFHQPELSRYSQYDLSMPV